MKASTWRTSLLKLEVDIGICRVAGRVLAYFFPKADALRKVAGTGSDTSNMKKWRMLYFARISMPRLVRCLDISLVNGVTSKQENQPIEHTKEQETSLMDG